MSALSLEQAPPMSVPFRFFLTGPLFGAAAGLVLAWEPEVALATRFAAPALASVHLVSLGFMLQVMAGALLQFLPVAAGATVARPRLVAALVHPALAVGAALLVAGFLGAGSLAFRAAVWTLGAALLFYAAVTSAALLRSRAIGPTLPALKAAVAGLLVTAGLGVALAGAFGWGWALPLFELTLVHAAWGVLGWALMLVAAVAYLVVPMFQLTPGYPVRVARAVPLLLGAGLLAWTAGVAATSPALLWTATAVLVVAAGGFATQTLRLQQQRKRKILDSTFWFWRLGMSCLLLAAALGAFVQAFPMGPWKGKLEYLLGVLLFGGAFPALIAGMLLKIVPFLGWLHLSRLLRSPPTMHQLVPEARARVALWLFGASLALLLGGVAHPLSSRAGGAVFALACLWLEFLVVQATRAYLRWVAWGASRDDAPAPHRDDGARPPGAGAAP